MKNLLAILLIGCVGFTYGQDDNKELAGKILSELSEEAKGHKTMSLDFKITVNTTEGSESQSGKAEIKGDHFHYKTDKQEVFSDGESVWSYNKGDNECNIQEAEEVSGGFDPSKIMTIWDDNFNYQYIKGDGDIHTIKLFPKDPQNSKYHTVILKIDRAKKQLKNIVIKTKESVTLKITISKFVPNLEISDSKFEFNKSKFPGVSVQDNR